ncbi:hypothetical protein [Nocardioides sp. Leaf285]|uniref:hypothetical protein n=1 Tax=Nocardioides sp. Leaf285 TaxID=1736322 RepID=UPI0007033918|nr:hypothetical protein [Nocardioides sp. Leaf285]KQP62848.1 hypothetical protein ASF47_17705 [Nocardioides sp. Leaf285]
MLYRLIAEVHEASGPGDPIVVGYYDVRTVTGPQRTGGHSDWETLFEDRTSREAMNTGSGRVRFRRFGVRAEEVRFIKIDGSRTRERACSFADRDTVWRTIPDSPHARALDGSPIAPLGSAPVRPGPSLTDLRTRASADGRPPSLRPHGATGYVEVFGEHHDTARALDALDTETGDR